MEKLTFEKLRELQDQAIRLGVDMVYNKEEELAEAKAEEFGNKLDYISDLVAGISLEDITTDKDEIKVLKRQVHIMFTFCNMIED